MEKIINLSDIEFLDDINKKFIFDNEQSSLTLISFKKGKERSIHVDMEDEVAQIIKGKAQITIGKEVYTLKQNEMIVMPKKIPHGLKAIEDAIMLLLRPKHEHK